MFDYQFLVEVLIGGLLSGVMYSLVAIGFVLIYKTSGVLNFAQGAMLLFAALTFVSLVERGAPFFAALAATLVIMVVLGIATERAVLRPLVNQPPITLFMATLGLSYVIEGTAQLLWGTQVHGLDIGISDVPFEVAGVLISRFDLFAAAVAGSLVALFALFFRYTRTGLSFRAVADDQFAALAVGLRLPRVWAAVWTVAGIVALVGGLLWGARLGVQFSLSLVVLKALPVLVLGGFDSIAGAIVGGLLVGAIEKLAEVYVGPSFGGGIEAWAAYVAALALLLIRPSGLFGQKLVEGVRHAGPHSCQIELVLRRDPVDRPRDCGCVRHRSARGVGLSARRRAHAIPGAVACCCRAQRLDRLCRAGLARLGRLPRCRRLRRVQSSFSCPRIAAAHRSGAGRGCRSRHRHRIRAAEPAVARVLSRGIDARRAVLRAVGADQIQLVLQRQSIWGD
ncbi:branched-subunit amino acid ABC-type transport system permease component [Bradyrhizobium sp. USDA 10063]